MFGLLNKKRIPVLLIKDDKEYCIGEITDYKVPSVVKRDGAYWMFLTSIGLVETQIYFVYEFHGEGDHISATPVKTIYEIFQEAKERIDNRFKEVKEG